MAAPLVFFDIAGPDADALKRFYGTVFDWHPGADDQVRVSVQQPLRAAIRADPVEKRLYLGVADVAVTLEAVASNGGKIDAPRFEVPGTVVLGLFRDPAGNPMGLVEMDGKDIRIP